MTSFDLRALAVLALLSTVRLAQAGAESAAEAGPADFARQSQEFEKLIAELAAIDPLQPDTL